MFYKLSLNNVKKSIKDYTIYFLTLTFGICLFYVFNSIESQQAMLSLNSTQSKMLGILSELIGYVSIFISVILGFLIVYANNFLIKRRKKELGIYMILGMEKVKISHILIIETLIIGVFALTVGLLVGIFASQGLAVLTAKMFEVKMKEFVFIFSSSALIKSILYFGIIFIVVIIFNTIAISRYQLIKLLTASKKNEKLRIKKLWISVILFLISIICLSIAYYLIIDNGMFDINLQFGISIFLGILGTFLFFLSLSGFLLKLVQANKNIYFKGLNMFVLRQINSKITTTFISMTLICLMLLITIGTLSSGAGFSKVMSSNLEKVTPFDVSLKSFPKDNKKIENDFNMMSILKTDGIPIDDIISDYAVTRCYNLNIPLSSILLPDITINILPDYAIKQIEQMPITFIPLSEYNNALLLQGVAPISLKDNEFAISCNHEEAKPLFQEFINQNNTLNINEIIFSPYKTILDYSYYTSAVAMDIGTVIVPDQVVIDNEISEYILNMQYKENKEACHKIYINAIEDIYKEKEKPYINWATKIEMYEQSAGLSTVVSYLAIYIGVVFLITSSAVLALQQLSESSDNIERYNLLDKIGVDEKETNKSIFLQISIYFMVPLVLAIIHSIVGIYVANNIIKTIGHIDASTGIIASAVVIILIYGGYMIATYLGSKSIVYSQK